MRKQLFSAYSLRYPKTVIYMLQRCEYEIKPFLKWYFKVENFNTISIRGSLVRTSKSKLLLLLLQFLLLIDVLGSVFLITRVFVSSNPLYWFAGIILLILAPFICVMLLIVPLIVARVFIVLPQQRILIKKSQAILVKQP